jgi:hypothetical protein
VEPSEEGLALPPEKAEVGVLPDSVLTVRPEMMPFLLHLHPVTQHPLPRISVQVKA